MLNGGEEEEKIMDDRIGDRCEVKAMGQVLPLIDVLPKAVSLSGAIFLLAKFLTIAPVIPI
jgi:hypothetical protein